MSHISLDGVRVVVNVVVVVGERNLAGTAARTGRGSKREITFSFGKDKKSPRKGFSLRFPP